MSIPTNYSQPVQVNGFTCRDCSEVELAKRHIDPAHPQSGPFDSNADEDPTRVGQRAAADGLNAKRVSRASTLPGIGDHLDIQV